jgi:hypothetical protein
LVAKLATAFLLSFSFIVGFGCAKTSSDTPAPSVPDSTNGGGSVDTEFICNGPKVAKGGRQFGMDILDAPSVGSYYDNLSNLKAVGAQFQTLHLSWRDIESAGNGSASGVFSDPYNAMSTFNSLAISDGIKVTLRIHPVDVVGKLVPSDLSAVRFNSANMQTRARAMLDYVFTRISPANITRIVVGNEVDGFNPGADTNFWLDYAGFLYNLNIYLDANYPTVQIGFVATANAVTDPTKTLASSGGQRVVDVLGDGGWAAAVDFVGITYYPLNSSSQMKPNSSVAGLFNSLVSFTSKPIHIEEVGYSSSASTSGSEALQAEFFCEVFKAWDTHASRIPSLAVLRMIDKSRADAETVAADYQLPGNESFIEYIRTLGVRTHDNKAKQSYALIKSELEKRGF